MYTFSLRHTHASYVTHQRQLFFEQLDLPLVAGSDGLVVVDNQAETVLTTLVTSHADHRRFGDVT